MSTERAGGAGVVAAVLTYNRRDSLRACLGGIAGQSVPPERTVVIDNASTDGTVEMLARDFPTVGVRRMSENKGCTGAMADALRAAADQDATYLWLLDDDAIPEPTCLQVLLAEMTRRSNGGPPLVAVRPTVADPSTGEVMGAGVSHGALLRMAAASSVLFPTPELFMGYDDKVWGQLIRRAGLRIVRLPQVLVRHPVRRRRRLGEIIRKGYAVQPWRLYYAIRNRLYSSLYIVPSPLQFIRFLGMAVVELTLLTAFGRPRRGQKLLLRGIVDGVAGRLGRRVNPPY